MGIKNEQMRTVHITYNASGAVQAALRKDITMIVDIIDMSTTAEAVLENGALIVFGASPDLVKIPVEVDPFKIGYEAGNRALKNNTKVIIVAEPRFGNSQERLSRIQSVKKGIEEAGAQVSKILPNVGAQINQFFDFTDQVVVIVSNSGGVAFDAAYNQGAAKVITGTIARTNNKKGVEPLQLSAQRAIKFANKYAANITLVAASSNSYEDILAVNKIAQTIIDLGFLKHS